MSASRSRTIAFDVLLRVAKKDAYADDELRAKLEQSVKPEDAGLATELVLGALRWQGLLDFAIDRFSKKRVSSFDAEVAIALRLGAYQLLFLDRIPTRAAVHESVELVKRAKKSSAATLVNAVLRKVADSAPAPVSRRGSLTASIPEGLPEAERLGILHSHPAWLVERWLRVHGSERTEALLDSNNHAPATSAYLFSVEHADEAAQSLVQTGCRVSPGRLLRDALVFEGGNPGASEAVRRGWVAIQDEASQAVARLLSVDPGDSVLDVCAAPGGKTLLLAKATGPKGRVIAADLHEHRVRAMKERFEQAGVRNVETITLDATQPLPFERDSEPMLFERILVDVPCSGTGTLARHPEIRWKLREEDLRDLRERQLRLLRNALPQLAATGRLVYSTCSLEPEENESVVREALGGFGDTFHGVNPAPTLSGLLQESVQRQSLVGADGFFRTFPPEHRTDGFFAAVIERRSAAPYS